MSSKKKTENMESWEGEISQGGSSKDVNQQVPRGRSR